MRTCPACGKQTAKDDRFCSGCGTPLVPEGPKDVLDDLIRDYQKELTDKPDDASILYNLGLTLERKGRPDDALAALRRVHEIEPQFGDVQDVIQRIERRKQNQERASAPGENKCRDD